MGGGKRHRPKSTLLTYLWWDKRDALDYDWLTRFGTVYRPLRWSEWEKQRENPSHSRRPTIGIMTAWGLTREILRDKTSHSFHALAKSAYVPTAEEMTAWDMLAAEKKLKQRSYRPWTDSKNDYLRPPHQARLLTNKQLQGREKLKAMFHIKDTQ